jgi:hypothetical protein
MHQSAQDESELTSLHRTKHIKAFQEYHNPVVNYSESGYQIA